MNYKADFLSFAITSNVLRFGEFTLKSGRISPYFFNAGLFNTGSAIAQLGRFYATAIAESQIQFDVLFGPAYKGIPLAALAAANLADYHHMDVGFSFDRKEIKDHGEGGNIVGAPLAGSVLVIDDVITAGTSVRHSIDLIHANGATLAGLSVCLDRKEKGMSAKSAIEEIESDYGVPVLSIVDVDDLIDYVATDKALTMHCDKIKKYRDQYGI